MYADIYKIFLNIQQNHIKNQKNKKPFYYIITKLKKKHFNNKLKNLKSKKIKKTYLKWKKKKKKYLVGKSIYLCY